MIAGRRHRPAVHAAAAAMLALAVLGLAAAVSVSALGWWGRTFPGFIVLANRVVATASLPGWPVEDDEGLFLSQVTAVDGRPVGTGHEVYARVAAEPPGTPFAYELRRDGSTSSRVIPTRVFQGADLALVFGSFLLNGLIFGLVGVAVWTLRPELSAARAMLAFGLLVATYVLAAVCVYDASVTFLRLHLLAEALLPAAAFQLALVFPAWRPTRWHGPAVALAWGACLLIGLTWQVVLFDAPRAIAIGDLCYVGLGLALSVFVGNCIRAYRRGSALERNKIRVVVLAALPAGVFPAALFALSGLTAGRVPVNSAAFTAFLFPLGLGYAIVRHDLFEIDTVVRRLVHYAVLTVLAMLVYAGVLIVSTDLLRLEAASPLLPLQFALGVVVVLLPLRDRVQRVVDRVCFRPSYDAREMLERTSLALGSTLDVEVIAATVVAHVDEALAIEAGALYLEGSDGRYRVAGGHGTPWGGAAVVEADHAALSTLSRNAVVTWYADPTAVGGPIPLGSVATELLVPMTFRTRLVGFLALGPRRSGRYYSATDAQFLRTLANQTALSILHAEAYEELQGLTRTLEQRVAERTAALGRANGDLQASVARVSEAYRELQQSQEKLIRAEKMATLGRLAAGVAHEVSTPLGATLVSLRMVRDLIAEYDRSVGDSDVTIEDHHAIARELDEMASRSERWTQKAASFILAVKAHTRGYDDGPTSVFDVARVVEETGVLLQHRATAAGCSVRARLPADLPALRGDPTRLGQVLANLVTNGIDAYEEAGRTGEVVVDIAAERGNVVFTVSDRGCGITPEHQARIFDELFTTKPPGRGTGLGLSIARDLVRNHFGGTMDVASVPGEGTTFTVCLPAVAASTQPGRSAA